MLTEVLSRHTGLSDLIVPGVHVGMSKVLGAVAVLAIAVSGIYVLHDSTDLEVAQDSGAIATPAPKPVVEPTIGDDPASALAPPRAADTKSAYVPSEKVFDRSQPAIARVDGWLMDARENASIAYDVGTVIGSCAAFPADDARVEDTMAQGTAGAVSAAAIVLDQQDFCVGLGKQHFDAALALLERSASSGLVEAQVAYSAVAGNIINSREEYRFETQRIENYRRNSIAFLAQAARQGSDEALANLSMIYSDGQVAPRDPQAALRYYREYLQRSGRNSDRNLRYLEQLEAAARAADG